MSNFWPKFQKILFHLDAEKAHHLLSTLIEELNDAAPFLVQRISGMLDLQGHKSVKEVLGLRFLSKVGLAAGFDKNARLVAALPNLGFGFCEIGTVTPLPQVGNDRPRMLRDPSTQSLFNRMGFNNDGAVAVAKNLAWHKKKIPHDFRVGVNIGKNKDSDGADIARDYSKAAEPFLDLADFFVINVSSPNTPGLRDLQHTIGLEPIIDSVLNCVAKVTRPLPVLIKLAPELKSSEIEVLLNFFTQKNISGLVLTNTLAGETHLGTGGWSGGRVRIASNDSLLSARKFSSAPIISVGGIDSVEVARARIKAGADLVELYSAWIFKGPKLPAEISSGLN